MLVHATHFTPEEFIVGDPMFFFLIGESTHSNENPYVATLASKTPDTIHQKFNNIGSRIKGSTGSTSDPEKTNHIINRLVTRTTYTTH